MTERVIYIRRCTDRTTLSYHPPLILSDSCQNLDEEGDTCGLDISWGGVSGSSLDNHIDPMIAQKLLKASLAPF